MRAVIGALWWLCAIACAQAAEVRVLEIDGAISPATADYAIRGLRQAADRGDALVVLKLDTPGGLDTAMRRIIREILGSPVPVASFVAPNGARAASAGTYILYASHVAAMAPATNLGAATPVQIGGGGEAAPARDKGNGKGEERPASRDTMKEKQINDAAAYIRGLAQLRGRNAEWAEKAVRDSVSLSAAEARKLDVVDLVADDVPALVKALNGRTVNVLGKDVKLDTQDAAIVTIEPDWRSRVLAIIADPNVALILMMLGVYGLIFEFSNPGFVLPGVAGGICLLLGLFALQMLPINYAGLALMFFGIACIVAEAFVPSFGTLGIGGSVALIAGMVMLMDPDVPGYGVPLPLIVGVAVFSAGLVFATVSLAARARRRPVVSGREDLLGAQGVMVQEGWARVRGELWRVVSPAPLATGQAVRVIRLDGLTLSVEPIT
ncbi:MAG TPA: nodulation protein NfeD, partial [Burkholderiales bacterium]|nr:nodulation protein NfeD [Burkholderiales bacterium]